MVLTCHPKKFRIGLSLIFTLAACSTYYNNGNILVLICSGPSSPFSVLPGCCGHSMPVYYRTYTYFLVEKYLVSLREVASAITILNKKDTEKIMAFSIFPLQPRRKKAMLRKSELPKCGSSYECKLNAWCSPAVGCKSADSQLPNPSLPGACTTVNFLMISPRITVQGTVQFCTVSCV